MALCRCGKDGCPHEKQSMTLFTIWWFIDWMLEKKPIEAALLKITQNTSRWASDASFKYDDEAHGWPESSELDTDEEWEEDWDRIFEGWEEEWGYWE